MTYRTYILCRCFIFCIMPEVNMSILGLSEKMRLRLGIASIVVTLMAILFLLFPEFLMPRETVKLSGRPGISIAAAELETQTLTLDKGLLKSGNLLYLSDTLARLEKATLRRADTRETVSLITIRDDAIYPYVIIDSQSLADDVTYEVTLTATPYKHRADYYLVSNQQFYSTTNKWVIFMMLSVGFSLATSLFNFLLFSIHKEPRYAFHGLFILVTSLMLFICSGMHHVVSGIAHGEFLPGLKVLSLYVFMLFALHQMAAHGVIRKYTRFLTFLTASVLLIMWATDLDQFLSMLYVHSLSTVTLVAVNYHFFKNLNTSLLFHFGINLFIITTNLNCFITMGLLPDRFLVIVLYYMSLPIEAIIFTLGIITQYQLDNEHARQLKLQAATDALTGLHNRHHFNLTLKDAFMMEPAPNYALLLLDIDHFKRINDDFGHEVGDMVLVQLASLLKQKLRDDDEVFRWGGEEFVLFIKNCDMHNAWRIAEKLRESIAHMEMPFSRQITASFGLAIRLPGESFGEWFLRADMAMLSAKASGRNRIEIAKLSNSTVPKHHLNWQSEFECGHPHIDLQHKQLLDGINKLIDAYNTGKSDEQMMDFIESLIPHIKQHFEDEETILLSIGYPLTDHHRNIHLQLLAATQLYLDALRDRQMHPWVFIDYLLRDVINNHLVKEDSKFFLHVAQTTSAIDAET